MHVQINAQDNKNKIVLMHADVDEWDDDMAQLEEIASDAYVFPLDDIENNIKAFDEDVLQAVKDVILAAEKKKVKKDDEPDQKRAKKHACASRLNKY